MKSMRNYEELSHILDFNERFEYLKLDGIIGDSTFGFDRYINQRFYRSKEWLSVRDFVIVRDEGMDMGTPDHPIHGRILVHHMNPISIKDISDATEFLLNPEYLICVSHNTHNAIHYGDSSLLPGGIFERRPNDTCPWRR